MKDEYFEELLKAYLQNSYRNMNEKNNNGNPKFGEEQAGEIMEKQRSFTTFEGGQGRRLG